MHKLQETTYKKYKTVWKQLLCFISRLVWHRQGPALHYVLTSSQSAALDTIMQAAAEIDQQDQDGDVGAKGDCEKLDEACLLLCIALLDHPLHGNVYDSIIIGFLAVLGINKHGSYHEPLTYTTNLSAFIKMAQLLVVERTVLAVEKDEVDHPADILDVMQDRFMVFGTRSPMNWAHKLRAYGKKVSDNTTALGFITWLDDGEGISYKGLEMSMTAFKRFVSQQVELAQAQLHELLLINQEETREAAVPKVSLRSLKDDPTINTLGWSFIKDTRNAALQNHEHWLLNRVANTDWL